MKRIILALVVALVLFTSCEKTKEEQVEKALYEYVKDNFDDPSGLKDLISIELHSSTSSDSIKNLLSKGVDNFYRIDSLYNYMLASMDEKLKTGKNEASERTMNRFKTTILDVLSMLDSDRFNDACTIAVDMKKMIEDDNIEEYDIEVFKVKCRTKKGNRTKIEYIYAIYDNTLDKDNITFMTREPVVSDLPDFYVKLFSDIKLLNDVCVEYLDNVNKLSVSLNTICQEVGVN